MRAFKIPTRVWLGAGVTGLTMLLVAIPLVSKNFVLQHLDTIQNQMSLLEEALQKPQPDLEAHIISDKIAQLSSHITKIHTLTPEELHQDLHETEYHLSSQITAIHDDVIRLASKQNAFVYLEAKYLPFHVISLDSIQEIAVASITYDFKTIAMEKGDKLAGWTLKTLSYGKQKLTFENNKKERILITTKEIGVL